MRALTLQDIREAHGRIRDKVHRTPILTSHVLNDIARAQLFFKCEHLQKGGAFKARGASNAVFSLSDAEARKGVVTHSSGNHAAALARAAKLRRIPAYVIMPRNAPKAKVDAVRRHDGAIVLCDSTLEARESTAQEVIASTGATFIHPYNDVRVIAGQGTTALELLEDVPDLDWILCPVGGGGLLAGMAVAAKAMVPLIRVVGAEPKAADDAARSLQAGQILPSVNPKTLADGLLTSLGDITFAEICRHVDDIVTVSEEEIRGAMRLLWEVLKQVVEPSGSVPFAAAAQGKLSMEGQRVGIVLSGGNLDLDCLPWLP